jgi:hypothetical protein
MRLIIGFSLTDVLKDGGKLFVQTNHLKYVHIINTSVSKLSWWRDLYFSISAVVRMEMSSPSMATGTSSCVG